MKFRNRYTDTTAQTLPVRDALLPSLITHRVHAHPQGCVHPRCPNSLIGNGGGDPCPSCSLLSPTFAHSGDGGIRIQGTKPVVPGPRGVRPKREPAEPSDRQYTNLHPCLGVVP
jgi:hypothetical protein